MSTAVQQLSPFTIQKAEPKTIEFVPFGADSKIKLSVKIVQELVCVPTRSGALCTERDAVRFMMLCQAQSLNPFAGDAFLIGYDGKNGPEFSLITAHVAFLKRAELHPEFDGMSSGVVVANDEGVQQELEGDFYSEGQKVIGGWAKVHFRNRKVPMFKKVRMEAFRKSFGVWVSNPEGMIVKVAEADALRSAFPTKLGGLYLDAEQPSEFIKEIRGQVLAPDFSTTITTVRKTDATQSGPEPTAGEASSAAPATESQQTTAPSAPAPPVPNETLGAPKPKKEKTPPEPGSREAMVLELRNRFEADGIAEKEFKEVCIGHELFPAGSSLSALPSATLTEMLKRYDAIKQEIP